MFPHGATGRSVGSCEPLSHNNMDRLSSMMLSNLAGEFLAAAQSLHSVNVSSSMPLYFLICQSIELSLKAYIRGCGAAREQLIKIGHDLEKALNTAQSEKLSQLFTVTLDQEQALRMINPYYAEKDLQYTEVGFKRYPDVTILLGLAEVLHSQIREFCEIHRECHVGKPTEVN